MNESLIILNSMQFFQENEEFSVHAGSEELGTIVKPPPFFDKYDEYLPDELIRKEFA